MSGLKDRNADYFKKEVTVGLGLLLKLKRGEGNV